MLAGVSVPYYVRLERGDMNGVSNLVLEALARALALDDAERAHLFDLARAAHPTAGPQRRRPARLQLRPDVQWTLDAITGAAALAGNERLDVIAANALGRALFSDLFTPATRPTNRARYVFLDPRAKHFYVDWEQTASQTVAILRRAAGRDPHDRHLTDLIGQLATQSEPFRALWAAHDVRYHASASKHFHHPTVGELDLSFNRVELAADDGLTISLYTPEPGSPSAEAMALLGSWAASLAESEPGPVPAVGA